jgi:hypothetical protein
VSISINGSTAQNYAALSSTLTGTTTSLAPKKSDLDTAFADFMKVAKETPIERLKDSILKSHGMTSDQYNAMPAGPAKDALTKEIQDAIKKAVAGNQPGTASQPGSASRPDTGFSLQA